MGHQCLVGKVVTRVLWKHRAAFKGGIAQAGNTREKSGLSIVHCVCNRTGSQAGSKKQANERFRHEHIENHGLVGTAASSITVNMPRWKVLMCALYYQFRLLR